MLRLGLFKANFLLLLIGSLGMTSYAENKVSINSGMDIYNRYVWRGLDIASTPSLTPIVTDYYFPNAGINFFNFNNYDAVTGDSTPDPGAHTIELGVSFTGAESFPITLAGYVNIHNDAGSNAYFQIDYPFMVGETQLSAFVGAATGSEDNPDYYGTDNLQVINLGLGSTRTIKLSDATSFPLNISFIINPHAEIAYLLAGISL